MNECMNMGEIYCKELAHVIMVAEKEGEKSLEMKILNNREAEC